MEIISNPYIQNNGGLRHILSWHETTQKGNCVQGQQDHYLLHLVLAGTGRFETNGQEFYPRAGDAFLIYPHTPYRYTSDEQDPWQYIWVHFDGADCEDIMNAIGFTPQQPVCRFGHLARLQQLHAATEQIPWEPAVWQLEHSICLLQFFQGLLLCRIDGKQPVASHKKRDYYDQAVTYIAAHLDDASLSAEQVAASVHICRKYLLAVFRECGGTSTQAYIIARRIEQAGRLLACTRLSVAEVARACGYVDPLAFSRVFKQKTGISPRAYRQIVRM